MLQVFWMSDHSIDSHMFILNPYGIVYKALRTLSVW
jgi:hypothetical protein